MIKDSILYKILSVVHIAFFTSMLCFGTVYLTAGIFFLPAVSAVFNIGKDCIFKEFDITDSIMKVYLRYFRMSIPLMKFFPVNMMILINIAGMLICIKSGYLFWGILCLVLAALLLTLLLYIAGYHTFVEGQLRLTDVMVSIFIKPYFLISVFVIMILSIFYFSGIFMIMSLIIGTFFLFAIEVMIFIQMLSFKKMFGKITDREQTFLAGRQNKKID